MDDELELELELDDEELLSFFFDFLDFLELSFSFFLNLFVGLEEAASEADVSQGLLQVGDGLRLNSWTRVWDSSPCASDVAALEHCGPY